jgi:hypothetical protein
MQTKADQYDDPLKDTHPASATGFFTLKTSQMKVNARTRKSV